MNNETTASQPNEPHWIDGEQSSLGGKTAREGYAANPEYAGLYPAASQPKSIEDDARCGPIQYLHNVCADVVPALLNCGRQRLADLLEGALRGLPAAPAAQASATIQAAPETCTGCDNPAGPQTADSHGFCKDCMEFSDRTPAATIQEPVMVAEPMTLAGFFAEAKRLGCKIPADMAEQLAAPMVADPAGVNALIDSIESGLGEIVTASHSGLSGTAANVRYVAEELEKEIDAYREAATVKAVPSEAMSRRVGVPDNMIQWAVRELLGALPERRDWLNPDAEAVLRAEFQRAAPLADKTGGGE